MSNQKNDKARCNHTNKKALYDHHVCTDCGYIRTDSEWGIARNMWFKNIGEANFYRKNGRLPDK